MADSKGRVEILNHKIERDKVRAGDHIYVHEAGGIFNKHGIVIWQDNEDITVAYYNEESNSIATCLLENFADGNCIRLYVYGASKRRKRLARKGSGTTKICVLSPEEVVQNVFYYLEHLDEVKFKQNSSESFATACTNRISLVVENPVFPAIDHSIFRANFYSHKIDRDDLEPGDQIYAYRKWGIYAHHGIYMGTNRSGVHLVTEFTGDPGTKKSKSTAKIRRSSLEDFLDGAELRLVTYNEDTEEECGISHALESLPAYEVVQIAEYYAENPDEWEDYHVITNNCEHFCIFCKTGESFDIFSDIKDQTKRPLVFPFALAYTL